MDIPMHPRPVGNHSDPRLTATGMDPDEPEDSTPIEFAAPAQTYEHQQGPPVQMEYYAPPQPQQQWPQPQQQMNNPFEMFGTSNPWLIIAVIFVGGFFLGKSMQTIVVKSA